MSEATGYGGFAHRLRGPHPSDVVSRRATVTHPSFTLGRNDAIRRMGRAHEEYAMLVLIATNELQGTSPDDYSFTVEGELVTPVAAECASGERCGCDRGFPGLASGFATTTAMVAERPGVTERDLRDAVFDWLDRNGWIELFEQTAEERAASLVGRCDLIDDVDDDVDDLIESIIDEHVDCIRQVCSAYPVGTVVVRRGTRITTRSMPHAA
jgi:hypothetical protein